MNKRRFKKKYGLMVYSVVIGTVSVDVPSEIMFYSLDGTNVGYWAYGLYLPKCDYQGQKFIKVVLQL